ncbi:hypothetical protein MSKU15_0165 [Komagataeibacter diospyri]|nr:hypothetical protein MSKU15_0165 [Komagataeibacter diospyri]
MATSGSTPLTCNVPMALPLAKPVSERMVRGRPILFSMARMMAAKPGASAVVVTTP